MNQVTFSFVVFTLAGLLLVLGLGAILFLTHSKQLLKPRRGRQGDWVAEVWLEWEVCRGSTMYRQRFSQRWMAYLAVRFHALVLDGLLPTHYWSTDWSGRPCRYRHEYAILYGVRQVLPAEAQDFHPVWSEDLPGMRDFSGEHPMSHPLERFRQEVNGQVVDVKL